MGLQEKTMLMYRLRTCRWETLTWALSSENARPLAASPKNNAQGVLVRFKAHGFWQTHQSKMSRLGVRATMELEDIVLSVLSSN